MKESFVVAALFVGITLMATPTRIHCGVPAEFTAAHQVSIDLRRLKGEVERHHARAGRAPYSWAELESMSTRAKFAQQTTDPWGRPYFMQLSQSGTQVRIGTLGCDGQVGGDDHDADLEFELPR